MSATIRDSGEDIVLKRMFVGSLPLDTTEAALTELFSEYGRVRGIQLATDVFSGKCKGFGFVDMEGHEARAAIEGLNGKLYQGNYLRVNFQEPRGKRGKKRR